MRAPLVLSKFVESVNGQLQWLCDMVMCEANNCNQRHRQRRRSHGACTGVPSSPSPSTSTPAALVLALQLYSTITTLTLNFTANHICASFTSAFTFASMFASTSLHCLRARKLLDSAGATDTFDSMRRRDA